MPENIFNSKGTFRAVALALLAAVISLIICRTVFMSWLVNTLVISEPGQVAPMQWSMLGATFAILGTAAFCAIWVVNQFGARRAFPYVCAAIIVLVLAHWLSARFLPFDILLLPMALAIGLAMLGVQALRLWNLNAQLTERLIHSSSKLNSLQADETNARLNSSLKLLDTMLSPQEIIVFKRDHSGELVTTAQTSRDSQLFVGLVANFHLARRHFARGAIT